MNREALYALVPTIAAAALSVNVSVARAEVIVQFASLHNLDWAQLTCDDIRQHPDMQYTPHPYDRSEAKRGRPVNRFRTGFA